MREQDLRNRAAAAKADHLPRRPLPFPAIVPSRDAPRRLLGVAGGVFVLDVVGDGQRAAPDPCRVLRGRPG